MIHCLQKPYKKGGCQVSNLPGIIMKKLFKSFGVSPNRYTHKKKCSSADSRQSVLSTYEYSITMRSEKILMAGLKFFNRYMNNI